MVLSRRRLSMPTGLVRGVQFALEGVAGRAADTATFKAQLPAYRP
jgi:hypothetical protein